MKHKDHITLTEIIEKEDLDNLTPEIDTDQILITSTELNRPALLLAGYTEYFDNQRIQLIGGVEHHYLMSFPNVEVRDKYEELTSRDIPCIIYTHGRNPGTGLIAACHRNKVPLLISHRQTNDLIAELSRWLKVKIAPCISVHGVLVDVYGEGVLIMGSSGVGKSEVAFELIRRGHRLVADDLVDIRKVSEATLVGSAPDLTRHFLELRGLGIIDIMSMFGVESVKDTQSIDMVINLEPWSEEYNFDRLGLDNQYTAFLGNRVVSHTIPISPGRNVAVLVEGAAVNNRAKKMGYNAAQDLCDRMTAMMAENQPAPAPQVSDEDAPGAAHGENASTNLDDKRRVHEAAITAARAEVVSQMRALSGVDAKHFDTSLPTAGLGATSGTYLNTGGTTNTTTEKTMNKSATIVGSTPRPILRSRPSAMSSFRDDSMDNVVEYKDPDEK